MTNEENAELSNYNNECDELKRKLPYQGIDKLCRKLERNLKDICGKDDKDGFLNYDVQYLQYWLLDKAIQTFSIMDPGKYNGIKSQFFRSWKSIIQRFKYETLCEPLSNLYYPYLYRDFNNGKYMFNFYYNFKYFEMKKPFTDNERKESCEHLSSMSKHFAKLKILCLKHTEVCSFIFKSSIDEYNPEILRKKVECNKYELDNTGLVERSVQEKPEGIISPSGAHSEYEERSGLGTSVHYPETSNSAMRVGFPLFGLLIIGFILLKFTPIRSWFYNRMIKKGKHAENLDEESSSELSNHYFETEELKSQGKGFSISYNTLQNIE
ncbi:Plasmodium vivax Vir protein, putative [Plasmodium ovale]|uniref:Plasmodium vivax Vir protein, putative n=1 Tax=Plasmodium ovale TaxID=36330 RepID=A0A1C3KWL2_PLAOA|nr:Plasmodium vivax Vir protein, putative [Plasmodium ovale]